MITVSAAGEIDVAECDLLDLRLAEATFAAQRGVQLDLDAVTFIDSTALDVMVRAVKRCRTAGKVFRVVNAKGQPRRVMELTGLLTLQEFRG